MALDEKTKQDMESGLEHAVRVVQARFTQSVSAQSSGRSTLSPAK